MFVNQARLDQQSRDVFEVKVQFWCLPYIKRNFLPNVNSPIKEIIVKSITITSFLNIVLTSRETYVEFYENIWSILSFYESEFLRHLYLYRKNVGISNHLRNRLKDVWRPRWPWKIWKTINFATLNDCKDSCSFFRVENGKSWKSVLGSHLHAQTRIPQ